MPKEKICFICGTKYEDSSLSKEGESNFCFNCRRIHPKVLAPMSSLAQQIINICNRIINIEERIKKIEEKNA